MPDIPSEPATCSLDSPATAELRARLNSETARVRWAELQRHFARGVVVRVDAALDLVEVALSVVEDRDAIVTGWLESGKLRRADDNDARDWSTRDPDNLWAVVAAPWVLVQERPAGP